MLFTNKFKSHKIILELYETQNIYDLVNKLHNFEKLAIMEAFDKGGLLSVENYRQNSRRENT